MLELIEIFHPMMRDIFEDLLRMMEKDDFAQLSIPRKGYNRSVRLAKNAVTRFSPLIRLIKVTLFNKGHIRAEIAR